MPPPGGPAAINGFLYQFLQHIATLTDAQFTIASGSDDDEDDWSVTFEPTQGGDTQIEGQEFIVEQYKVRDGTWSIADLTEVLLGLRKAVPADLPHSASYRFVTSGRPGVDVMNLVEFALRMKAVVNVDAINALDVYKYGDMLLTDAEMFAHLREATRAKGSTESADEDLRVLHLLACFDVTWEYTLDDLREAVDLMLDRYFYGKHNATKARLLLLGRLQEDLANGQLRLTRSDIDKLFVDLNLDPELPKRMASLDESMAIASKKNLGKAAYAGHRDIRRSPIWPEDSPVLILVGESGSGKTWQLARLVSTLADDKEVVAWISAAESAEAMIRKVANDIWGELQQVGELTLKGLEITYRKMTNRDGRWLTIAIDNVQTPALAEQLISNADWATDGVRLAMSASNLVGHAMQSRFGNLVHVIEVPDFGVQELTAFLASHGKSWAELPWDLKQLLKRPVLAGTYVQLPYSSFQRAPRTEYEIFDAFWKRIALKAAPGDEGVLLALAARAINPSGYPVARPDWGQIGLDENSAARLVSTGWLRIGSFAEASFAHERLLNWVLAKELNRRVVANQLSPKVLAAFIIDCWPWAGGSLKGLGYAPMDLIWMLASVPVANFNLNELLETLEEPHRVGGDLYAELLPSIGPLAIPLLLNRLDAHASTWDYFTIKIKRGLMTLATQEGVKIVDTIEQLLAAQSISAIRVGMELALACPSASHLEQLWCLREWHKTDPTNAREITDGKLWCDATRACAAKDPEWIVSKVHDPDSSEEDQVDLAFVLVGLNSVEARRVWEACKAKLAANFDPNRLRALLCCIRRFCDASFTEFTKAQSANPEGFHEATAISALAQLSPEGALEYVAIEGKGIRWSSASSWLPTLHYRGAKALDDRIRELVKLEDRPSRTLALTFSNREEMMSPALFGEFLDYFGEALTANGQPTDAVSADKDSDRNFGPELSMLANIADAQQLAILRAQQNSPLEAGLLALAKRRIVLPGGMHDSLLEDARAALLHIAGDGIRELILAEIGPDSGGLRGAIAWGMVAGEGAAKRLAEVANQSVSSDPAARHNNELYLAIKSLASLGASAELISVLEATGAESITRDLEKIWGNRPIEPAFLNLALEELSAPSGNAGKLRTAIVLTWLSNAASLRTALETQLANLYFPSPEAALAYEALMMGKTDSAEAMAFASRALQDEDSRWMGVNLLIRAGPPGIGALRTHLQCRPKGGRNHIDYSIVQALHAHPAHSDFAEGVAIESLRRHEFDNGEMLKIAAGVKDPEVQGMVIEAAFRKRSNTDALKAIAGMHEQLALEAALKELIERADTADRVCKAILRLNSSNLHVEWFIGAAKVVPKDRHGAIGRALRLMPATPVLASIEGLLGSETQDDRILGLTLARWTAAPSDERILELVASDPEHKVRDAAMSALQIRGRLTNALTLLAEFPMAKDATKRSLLYALVKTIHRGVLTNRSDSLWLGTVLDDSAGTLIDFAESLLERKTMGKGPMGGNRTFRAQSAVKEFS